MIRLESLCGEDAKNRMEILASFRIEYFREFPYLYDGAMAYELEYLDGFFKNPKACLIIGWDGERPVAVSTSIPLLSEYEIEKDAARLFDDHGRNAADFMYFGEIIIAPQHRGQRLSSRIFADQEASAAKLGYSGTCFLVVERSDDHPLKPAGYMDPHAIWEHMGYQKTEMVTRFNWPTLQMSGGSKDQPNPMAFWVKQF